MKILGFLSLLFVFNGTAQAEFDLTALGGFNFAAPTQRISGVEQHWIGDSGTGYGLLISSDIFSTPFDLEAGVILLSGKYERDNSGQTITRKLDVTQIPILIRYSFDDQVGLGLGAYLSYSRGIRDPALTAGDQGLLLSIRAKFHVLPPISLILDARYQHGLANMAINSSDLYNTRSVQFFAGFCLTLSKDHASQKVSKAPAGRDL